jgi:uncharacterized membrane protein YraQ (UPF0718 family)/copper chaperone CopZ
MILGYSGVYFKELYTVFMDMAPYFFFGLAVAGILHVFMKKEFIARHLQKDNFLSVIKAALLGVPLPLCSCGVVPAALSLRKSKASEGATVAFLISTPQTGADSIIATYGLLGIVFAVFTPFAALASGIAGGLMTLIWRSGQRQEVLPSDAAFDCNICFEKNPHSHSLLEKVKKMAVYAYREFLDDISVRLGIGIAISAVIALVVPDNFFAHYVSNDFVSMLLMIAVGIPLYVCATASIPIALAMIDKGLSPGAAFVFLTVGPATNMATITLIATTMGKRIVTIYLGVIAVMAIINGTILNIVFKTTGAPLPVIEQVHAGHMHGAHHALLPTLFAAAFSVILAASFFRRARETVMPGLVRLFSRASSAAAQGRYEEHTLIIEGMSCMKCRNKVAAALKAVPGVSEAQVDLVSCTAKVNGSASTERLIEAVEKAGYKATDKPIR